MSDQPRLTHKLALLADQESVYRDGWRVISNGVYPPPLNAILDEIDTTILQRRLTFRAETSHVTVMASGRRLFRICDASDDLPDQTDVLDQMLSLEETDALATALSAIAALAQKEAAITVESARPDDESMRTDIGISTRQMGDALEVDPDTAAAKALRLFLESGGAAVSRCLMWDGAGWAGAEAGDPESAQLLTFATGRFGDLRAAGGDGAGAEAPQLMVFDGAAGPNRAIAAAWVAGEMAVLAVDRPKVGDLVNTWRRVFAFD